MLGFLLKSNIVEEVDLVGFFFFSSRRRHTRLQGDWSSDVCSSDLASAPPKNAIRSRLPCVFVSSIAPPPKPGRSNNTMRGSALAMTTGGATTIGGAATSGGARSGGGRTSRPHGVVVFNKASSLLDFPGRRRAAVQARWW